MTAYVCETCGAWLRLPTVREENADVRPLYYPAHRPGKARGTARPCPGSGEVIPVWAPPVGEAS